MRRRKVECRNVINCSAQLKVVGRIRKKKEMMKKSCKLTIEFISVSSIFCRFCAEKWNWNVLAKT